MITRDLLRSLRNDLPMAYTIRQLGPRGPCAKFVEGRLRFICPYCGEFLAAINPRNNLAHCFACQKNFNNIDLLLTIDYKFRDAVNVLQTWLRQYRTELDRLPVRPAQAGPTQESTLASAAAVGKAGHGIHSIGAIIRQEFGNPAPRQ